MQGRSHTHRLRVRYSECDPQGHVFNANYVTYFDIALTELWREAIGPFEDMVAAGVDLVVKEATARYHAPARFDEELDVAVSISHLGTTSMVTDTRVTRGETLIVDGRMVHVFVDAATVGKIEIPPPIRRALAAAETSCTTSA